MSDHLTSEKTLEQKRRHYQSKEGAREKRRADPRLVMSTASVRSIIGRGGKAQRMKCLSTEELAQVLGYHYVTVYRWQGEGQFPKPTLAVKGMPHRMYSVTQATRIAKEVQAHQVGEARQIIRPKDPVVRRLFEAMK